MTDFVKYILATLVKAKGALLKSQTKELQWIFTSLFLLAYWAYF
jgi:hypothetical protein